MSLLSYTVKRLILTFFILVSVLFITFMISRALPGSPFDPENGRVSNAVVDSLNTRFGFNDPPLEQFWRYLTNIIHGDWGESITLAPGVGVWDYIALKWPITFELAITTTVLSGIIGIKAGIFSAVNKNQAKDTIVRFIALLGVSIPVFWLGMVLKYVLAIQWDLFPTVRYMDVTLETQLQTITGFGTVDSLISGRFDIFVDILWHMFLPIFCLTFISVASITRQTRSSMLEVLELDYIRSARAKGCKEKDVINKHALKNALIPTVTVIGMSFGGILGGAVLTETTFQLNGFGMTFVSAIQAKDYFVITALGVLTAAFLVVANLVTDLLYAVLDPRIRY